VTVRANQKSENQSRHNDADLPRFDKRKIPVELHSIPQWVVWKKIQKPKKHKPDKVPFDPHTGLIGDPTDPAKWGPLEVALDRFYRGGFAGIGFVLTNGYCGFDGDECVDPDTGEIAPWALEIVRQLDSYTEFSPSGTGLHILCKARLPEKGKKRNLGGRKVEIYCADRFFTFTCNHLLGTPFTINNRQSDADKVYSWILEEDKKQKEAKRKAKSQTRNKSDKHRSQPPPRESSEREFKSPPLTDAEVIEFAMNAANGEKFERVWYGDIMTDYDGDDSRADQGLCLMIAFWTQEWEQIERLWLASKLNREKLGRADYRQRTIQYALDNLTERYDPARFRQAQTASNEQTGRTQIICKMFAELNISDEVFRSYIATRIIANGRKTFKMGGLDLARYLRKTYNDDEVERRFGSDRINQMREAFKGFYPLLTVKKKGGGINRDGSPGERTLWRMDETPFIEAEKRAQELIADYLPTWQLRYPESPALARKIALWQAREQAAIQIAQRFRPATDEIPPIPEISDPVSKLYSRETKIKNHIIEDMKRLVGVWQDLDYTRGEMVLFKLQLDKEMEDEFQSGLDPDFRRRRRNRNSAKKQAPSPDFSAANTSGEKGKPFYRRNPDSYDKTQPQNGDSAAP
jgi:hypothetical protein